MLTSDRLSLPSALTGTGLMAIVRAASAGAAEGSALALAAAGVRMLEISFTTPDAAAAVRRVRTALPPTVLVGAGTVLDGDDAARALDHGADFLVAPSFDPDVAARAAAAGAGYYPGAATPTEIVTAWRAGATAVKVFPGGALGLPYFRALREPLPSIPLLAVGGVTAESAPSFISAGAVAVGLGGALWAPGIDLPALLTTLASTARR